MKADRVQAMDCQAAICGYGAASSRNPPAAANFPPYRARPMARRRPLAEVAGELLADALPERLASSFAGSDSQRLTKLPARGSGKGRLSAMARSCVVDGAPLFEKYGAETDTPT